MNLLFLLKIVPPLILFGFSLILFWQLQQITFKKDKVSEISLLLSEGIKAFLKRVLSSVIQLIIYFIIVVLSFSIIFHKSFYWEQIFAFLIGCILMCFSLFISLVITPKMFPKIVKNVQTELIESISIVFRISGALAFFIIGTIICGLIITLTLFGLTSVIGYALGIILTGFLFRIGGGLYKSSTDIGAKISSRVEKNVPDFDARNPASILEIIGKTISGIMGFTSDVFGSFMLTLVSCLLFADFLKESGVINYETAEKLKELPFYILFVALLVAIVAYFYSQFRMKKKYSNSLLEGIYLAVIILSVATYFILEKLNIYFDTKIIWGGEVYFSLFIPYLIGLVGAVAIGFGSEYFGSKRYKIAKDIASEAEYGTTISILNGIAISFKSSSLFLVFLLLIIIPSIYFAGFYGIAMAAMGMLSIITTILITKIFAPLASNTYKIVSLAQSNEIIIKHTKKIDNLGLTTVALGNGFAVTSAILSSFSILFLMILLIVKKISLASIFLDFPFLIGLILGIAATLAFAGFLLRGLVNTIIAVVKEVKRQFRDIPYLYEDKARPDIIKASDFISFNSMNALTISTVIMLLVPICIAYFLGFLGLKILLGFVLGTTLTGLTKGFYWANLGDALGGAKQVIEDGGFGGKKSVNFENILIANNFGDAFKDLLTPAINILIKAVVIVTLLLILQV